MNLLAIYQAYMYYNIRIIYYILCTFDTFFGRIFEDGLDFKIEPCVLYIIMQMLRNFNFLNHT